MASIKSIFTTLAFASWALGAPEVLLERDGQCDADSTVKGKSYIVNNNLWNSKGKTGSQCITGGEKPDGSVAWSTTWQWSSSDDQVVSFANSQAVLPDKKLVSDIATFKTHADWSYDTDPDKADVAIDIFTHGDTTLDCGVKTDYEIMIWLNKYGSDVHPKGDVIEETTLAQNDWTVYFGDGKDGGAGGQPAYSFLSKTKLETFDGDAMDFINYLAKLPKNPFPADKQNLVCAQFGTEAWKAEKKATFNVKSYSAAVVYK